MTFAEPRIGIESDLRHVETLVAEILQNFEDRVRLLVIGGGVGIVVHQKIDAHRHHQFDVAGDHPGIGGTVIAVERLAPIVKLIGVFVQIVAAQIIGIFRHDFRDIEHFARRFVHAVPGVIEHAHVVAVRNIARGRGASKRVGRGQIRFGIFERRKISGIFYALRRLIFGIASDAACDDGANQRGGDPLYRFFHSTPVFGFPSKCFSPSNCPS